MIDGLDDIVARYAEQEVTLEEAVEQTDIEEREFKAILRERDIDIRPYPVRKHPDEIPAYLAREIDSP